jgi:fumarate hydratase subunit alpha
MREIRTEEITRKVKDLCISANYELGEDVINAFERAREEEESPTGKEIFNQLIENARIAGKELIPLCQDTGFAVCFVELGDEVKVVGGNLIEAINEGVRQGYREGYLRKSICHPFTRKNTHDNTPAIVHVNLVPGNKLKIVIAPKGGGSENMSRASMLKPSDGVEGIKEFVISRVKEAGSNPCPPIVVGVGIGGTLEKAALLAKEALIRPLGTHNPDPEIAELERELLTKINDLGIGPQGLGGRITALAVNVDIYPCHIASLPVAVNINCHAHRHKEVVF